MQIMMVYMAMMIRDKIKTKTPSLCVHIEPERLGVRARACLTLPHVWVLQIEKYENTNYINGGINAKSHGFICFIHSYRIVTL